MPSSLSSPILLPLASPPNSASFSPDSGIDPGEQIGNEAPSNSNLARSEFFHSTDSSLVSLLMNAQVK